jgi:acetylornithine deacetylase
VRGKANMLARYGSGTGGLVLSGHTDTVPFDQSGWEQDPFRLRQSGQHLYGLGTCDMKGFFAIIIEALRGMQGAVFEQPLLILATADEESSMSGARALKQHAGLSGRAAVIGEPTGLQPIRMHKGIMMDSMTVIGKSGHSSNPQLGNSALEGMHELMGELLAFRSVMQQRYQNRLFEVAVPTMNLGHIHGGDSPNRICGHCRLGFDLRPLPGMALPELRNELDRIAQTVAQRRGLTILREPMIGDIPPFETPEDSALVRACEAFSGRTSGAVAFATEAPFLQELGLETIVMGAGSIEQAHQPNEFLALEQVSAMTTILQQLIRRYCVQDQ